ncbi:MAG TPA: TRL-like family protein [Labilithrix sp.]|nr:TRL-like family protein [Labilithrix sp.]
MNAPACASSILGVVATGDASLEAAKAAGGITQVAHVDHDNFSVLGVYAKTCTIVVGQ